MDAAALDPASLGIGLVGVAITLAGIVMLRPSEDRTGAPSDNGTGAGTEGRRRTSP